MGRWVGRRARLGRGDHGEVTAGEVTTGRLPRGKLARLGRGDHSEVGAVVQLADDLVRVRVRVRVRDRVSVRVRDRVRDRVRVRVRARVRVRGYPVSSLRPSTRWRLGLGRLGLGRLGLGLGLELCSWRMTVHEIHSPKEPSHGAYVRAYTGMCVWYEIMRGTSFHSRAMYLYAGWGAHPQPWGGH